ncbi:MAG: carboxypeptidase regulatory-like domain-containing protein [Acidobacteriota bacterium]
MHPPTLVGATLRLVLALLFLAPTAALAVEPKPSIALKGGVYTSAGEPAPNVTVELLPWLPADASGRQRLHDEPPPEAITRATTNATGRYRLEAPGPGVWRVRLTATDHLPIQLVPIVAVHDRELPPAELRAARQITGRAVDASGKPVPTVWVFATDRNTPRALGASSPWRAAFRVVRTAALGDFSFPIASDESLDVTLLRPEGSITHESFTGGDITVASRSTTHRLKVVDEQGEPVEGVLVRHGALAWPSAVTDERGQATLAVNDDVGAVSLSTADGRRLRQRLTSGASTTLVLPAAVSVGGRVLDADRRPLVGALVWLAGDPGTWALTGADGTYRLMAPADDEQPIQAEAPGHIARRALLTTALLGAGRAPTLALERAVGARGNVVDARGEPVPGATLAALHRPSRGGRPFQSIDPADDRAFSTQDGTFRLSHLQPGERYAVVASSPGGPIGRAQLDAPKIGDASPSVTIILTAATRATGLVIDADERPVPGAEIMLTPSGLPARRLALPGHGSENEAFRTVSNEKGRFVFEDIPAAELDVAIRAQGFAPMRVSGVVASSSEPAETDAPRAPADLGTFVLLPGVAIHGVVRDLDDEPIAGVAIHPIREDLGQRAAQSGPHILQLDRRRAATQTDEEGRFSVDDLPRGARRSLWARAPGYLPANVEAIQAPTTEPIIIVLEPAATIVGRVVNQDDEPVAGAGAEARWQIVGSDGEPVGRHDHEHTTTDDDGRFRIDTPPGVRAQVLVGVSDFIDPPPVEVDVPTEGATDEILFTVEKGSVVTGTVTDDRDEPIDGIRVLAGGAAATTDAEGSYRMKGARPGPTIAEAIHPSYGRHRQELTIETGSNTLDWRLPAGQFITGRVVDDQRQPLAGATVEIELRSGEEPWSHRSTSDADGAFRIEPVPIGRYEMRAHHPGHARTVHPELVSVVDLPVENLVLVLRPGTTVTGTLRGLDFEELATVRVEAHGERGVVRRGRVDYEGTYRVQDLEPGAWQIIGRTTGRRRQAQTRLVATPDSRLIERDLAFGRGIELTGTVRLDGQPLQGAMVSIRGESVAIERFTSTDHRGDFRFADLEPSAYRLGVSHTREEVNHNDRVDVRGNRHIQIDLEPISIRGRVIAQDTGEPIDNALILAERLDTPGMISHASDPDGRFLLRRTPPGRYRISVRKDGWTPAQQQIDVRSGVPVDDLELILEPTRGLTLDVQLSSGAIPPSLDLLLTDPSGNIILAERRRIDGDGNVHLTTAPPGTWILLASAPGGALVKQSVDIPASDTQVILPVAGRLTVQIPDLVESNQVGTLTLVSASGTSHEALDLGERSVRQTWPVVAGVGVVTGVPAGTWELRVETGDGRRWVTSVGTDGRDRVVVVP